MQILLRVIFRKADAVGRKIDGKAAVSHKVSVAQIANRIAFAVHFGFGVDDKPSVVHTVGVFESAVITENFAQKVKDKVGVSAVKQADGFCDAAFELTLTKQETLEKRV